MKAVFFILFICSFNVMCSTISETEKEEITTFKCTRFYDSLSGLYVYSKFTYEPTLNRGSGSFLEQFREEIELLDCEIDKSPIKIGFIINENGKLIFPRLLGDSKKEHRKIETCLLEAISNIYGWYPGKCKDSIVSCYVEKIIQIHY